MEQPKESLYDIANFKAESLKNRGFDYKDSIMKKTLSKYLFRNPRIAEFVGHLNGIFFEYIESVKKIRVYYNFAVTKNYRKIP